MSEKCMDGKKRDCPYRMDCESDEGVITSLSSRSPLLIFLSSGEWSNSTKTWSDEKGIYACQPENLKRQRNLELMQGENFYGEYKKREITKVSKDILKGIEELMVTKGLIGPRR